MATNQGKEFESLKSNQNEKLDAIKGIHQAYVGQIENHTNLFDNFINQDMKEVKYSMRNSKTDLKKLKQIFESSIKTIVDECKELSKNQNCGADYVKDSFDEFNEIFSKCIKEKMEENQKYSDEKSEEILKKICDYKDLIKVLNESQIELKTLQTESNR